MNGEGKRCTQRQKKRFVHDFDFSDTEKEELGGVDHIPGRDAMVGDDTPPNLEIKTLCHEVGHLLGLVHVSNDNQLLGTSRINPGLRISRQEADKINPGFLVPSPPARQEQPSPRTLRAPV